MVAWRALRRRDPTTACDPPPPPEPPRSPEPDDGTRSRRWLWRVVVALVLAGCGSFVLWPALEDTPAPPPPWGLWIGADYPADRTQKLAVSFYTRIDIRSAGRCDSRAAVTVEVSNLLAPAVRARRPAAFALAAANASLADVAFRVGAQRGWRPADVRRDRAVSIATTRRVPWAGTETVQWRLRVGGITRSAGYKACYLTTPQLFPLAADDAEWTRASSARGTLAARGEGAFFLDLVAGARVNVSADAKVPDRATLDAGAFVVRQTARLSCRDVLKEPPDEPPDLRALVDTRSNCASVQTFSAPNATREVDRRFFVAAFLIGLAGALVLDAIFEPRGRRRRRG